MKSSNATKSVASLSTCSMDSFDASIVSEEDKLDTLIEGQWTRGRLQAIAVRWKLSNQEQERLAELQHRLVDVQHIKNDPEEVVRFVRETNSIKAAERMFRKFIQFRIEQVDGILDNWDPDPLLKSHFPQTLLNGCDRDGDGIWIERPGATDCYGLYERFGGKELLRYCLWAREAACHSPWKQAYVAENNQQVRLTCIVDVKGLNRSHIRPALLPIFAELIQGIQNYYCGFIKKIIIIREPAIFKVVWNLIKHVFNENMREMMVFAGSDYENVLREYIDDIEDVLPPCLLEGGRGTIAEGMPPRLEGGKLPSKNSSWWTKTSEEEIPPAQELQSSGSERSASTVSSEHAHDCHRHLAVETSCANQTTIQLNPMTDHESMGVRCQLLVKGSF